MLQRDFKGSILYLLHHSWRLGRCYENKILPCEVRAPLPISFPFFRTRDPHLCIKMGGEQTLLLSGTCLPSVPAEGHPACEHTAKSQGL